MRKQARRHAVGVRRSLQEFDRRQKHGARLRAYHVRRREFNQRFRPKQEYADSPAPEVFSILNNRSATVSYMQNIDKNLQNRIFTRLNLSGVKETDLATICLLTGYMLDSKTRSPFLEVVIPPKGTNSRKLFDEVEFDRMVIKQRRRQFTSGRFLSRSDTQVNTDAIEDILNVTVDFFGEERRNELLNLSPVIVEIVENTGFHADPKKENKLPWIFNTHIVRGDGYRELEYCIVDLGVGMYDSIKKNVEKWNTAKAKVIHRLTAVLDHSTTQSGFLTKNIPNGIGSSTNEIHRGKGVQYVALRAKDEMYQVFDIITNKAHVKLKDMSKPVKDIPENLSATIYYWKIRFND